MSCDKAIREIIALSRYKRDLRLPIRILLTEHYQLGEHYFVSDGNHRVAVSKWLALPAIKAAARDQTPASVDQRRAFFARW